jgi:hypothetical protein
MTFSTTVFFSTSSASDSISDSNSLRYQPINSLLLRPGVSSST